MEVYQCISCKKITEGFPATLRRKKIKSLIRKEDKKSKRPKEDNDNSIKDHQNQDKPEIQLLKKTTNQKGNWTVNNHSKNQTKSHLLQM